MDHSSTEPETERTEVPLKNTAHEAATSDSGSATIDLAEKQELTSKHDPNETIAPRPPRWKWLATCAGLYLGALLYGLDTTIAANVQAAVYRDLGELNKIAWVGSGFPLGSVAFILLLGRAYNQFEIKWLMISMIVMFEAGSALCGAAPTMDALIVGRIMAGIGGAGMYNGCLNYISVFLTLKEQAFYNALIGLSWGCGAILGPVVGGAFSDSTATWRWAFYINLPMAALLSPIYIFIFPTYSPHPEKSVKSRLSKLDWVGWVLNAAMWACITMAMSFSGGTWAWSSAKTIIMWVFAGLTFTAFMLQQTFCIFTSFEDRLFPIQFLKSRTMILLYIVTATSSAGTCVTLYYIPLFFQFTRGDSALKAAVRIMPFIVVYVTSIMTAGVLLPKYGRYVIWYYPSGILLTVAGSLMYMITPTTKTAAIYGFEAMIAVGVGLTFQNAYTVAASKLSDADHSWGIGFINVAQIGTISLVLSMAGSIFQNVGIHNLKEAVGSYNFPEAYLGSALAGTASPIFQNVDPTAKTLIIGAIVKTIAKIFALVISSGAVMLACALGMKHEKLKLTMAAGG